MMISPTTSQDRRIHHLHLHIPPISTITMHQRGTNEEHPLKSFLGRHLPEIEPGLAPVKQILAVASGKGGVGKSVSTVLLARALNKLGYSVGIMDCDIVGPSLPLLTDTVGTTLEVVDEHALRPPRLWGIKLASPGWLQSPDEPQILRGPIASRMVLQWLESVMWGDLDFLLLDYPPGTGDIPLSLAQGICTPMAAVLTTTPHPLAWTEAEKTLQMFHSLSIDVLGWIETMSYIPLTPGLSGERLEIHGPPGSVPWQKTYGLRELGSIPMDPTLSQRIATGSLLNPHWSSDAAESYLKASHHILSELRTLNGDSSSQKLTSFSLKWSPKMAPDHSPTKEPSSPPSITNQSHQEVPSESNTDHDKTDSREKKIAANLGILEIQQHNDTTLMILWSDQEISYLDVIELRKLCPCAWCDERRARRKDQGKLSLKTKQPGEQYSNVRPVQIRSCGRYALKIEFSDQHRTGIYSYEFLRSLPSSSLAS